MGGASLETVFLGLMPAILGVTYRDIGTAISSLVATQTGGNERVRKQFSDNELRQGSLCVD